MSENLPIAVGCPTTPPISKKTPKYNRESFEGPGGEDYDESEYRSGGLRADLCELAAKVSFEHGHRIVDLILAKYEVMRK
jgi:hypothetical protein